MSSNLLSKTAIRWSSPRTFERFSNDLGELDLPHLGRGGGFSRGNLLGDRHGRLRVATDPAHGYRGVAPFPPQVVQRKVVGDREQPRRELGSRPIALARLVNPQEDILAQVLRLLEAADKMIENADEPVLIPLDQGFKRAWAVVPHLEHQPDVRVSRLQLPFQNIELATAHREFLHELTTVGRGDDWPTEIALGQPWNALGWNCLMRRRDFPYFIAVCVQETSTVIGETGSGTGGDTPGLSRRRRSWPQAASMAWPLVLRTVALTPRSRRTVTNRRIASAEAARREVPPRDCKGSG